MRWIPLATFILTQTCIWFVTTFVVLCPLVAPGLFVMRPQATNFAPSKQERALGWLLLLVYQILLLLAATSVARTVLTRPGMLSPPASEVATQCEAESAVPGEIPSWLRSDGRSDLHSYSNLLQA